MMILLSWCWFLPIVFVWYNAIFYQTIRRENERQTANTKLHIWTHFHILPLFSVGLILFFSAMGTPTLFYHPISFWTPRKTSGSFPQCRNKAWVFPAIPSTHHWRSPFFELFFKHQIKPFQVPNFAFNFYPRISLPKHFRTKFRLFTEAFNCIFQEGTRESSDACECEGRSGAAWG